MAHHSQWATRAVLIDIPAGLGIITMKMQSLLVQATIFLPMQHDTIFSGPKMGYGSARAQPEGRGAALEQAWQNLFRPLPVCLCRQTNPSCFLLNQRLVARKTIFLLRTRSTRGCQLRAWIIKRKPNIMDAGQAKTSCRARVERTTRLMSE